MCAPLDGKPLYLLAYNPQKHAVVVNAAVEFESSFSHGNHKIG
jgi:hypothetical protein